MCIENITVHKKILLSLRIMPLCISMFMNHSNMYINVYKEKCNRGFVGKEMLVNGKRDEKWVMLVKKME